MNLCALASYSIRYGNRELAAGTISFLGASVYEKTVARRAGYVEVSCARNKQEVMWTEMPCGTTSEENPDPRTKVWGRPIGLELTPKSDRGIKGFGECSALSFVRGNGTMKGNSEDSVQRVCCFVAREDRIEVMVGPTYDY